MSADTFDEGYEPIPAGLEPLNADDELALEEDLAVAGAQPTLTVATGPPPPLGRTPAIDFLAGTFVPFVSGGPLMLRGTATLSQWCEKCLRTRRGENPAVDGDFGVTVVAEDLIDGDVVDESAIAEAIDDWTEALLVHPRVSGVEEWSIDYLDGTDYVNVSFRVIPEGDNVEQVVISNLELPIGG